MPSENKTVNYGLNQWQGNEYPKRQDFVDDNLIIDTEMKVAADAAAAKIPKSLATASDQVLVSSGVGAWIVKTLAQFKAWLGLGSAAYKDESDFETPSGAQTKADAALSAANGYTDGAVDALAGEGNTTTVKAVDDALKSHLSETANLVDATNTNNYVFDTGSNITLHDLQILTFTVANASTGNVTIKVDNNAAVPLYKQGIATNAPVKSYKPFRAWYSLYSNCFFMIASAEGDAVAADVLAGKKFSNDNDTGIAGIMPNQGQKIITPSTVNQIISAGYHNGNGYVQGDANLVASNIKRGVNIFGVAGNYIAPTEAVIGNVENVIISYEMRVYGTTYEKVARFTVNFAGVIKIAFDAIGSASSACYCCVEQYNSAGTLIKTLGNFSSTNGYYESTPFTIDNVAVSSGDQIVFAVCSPNENGSGAVKNIRLYTNYKLLVSNIIADNMQPD